MEYEVEKVKEFVKAGKALFTIRNQVTGGRFTFRVSQPDRERKFWFVNVLNGPDNYSNYLYIGAIFDTDFRQTRGSKVDESAQSFKAFKWFWSKINTDALPEQLKVYHKGKCGRCGRRLTVPESIEAGFGPECINMV